MPLTQALCGCIVAFNNTESLWAVGISAVDLFGKAYTSC